MGRKALNRERINLTLPKDELRFITQKAREEKITRGEMIERLIQEMMESSDWRNRKISRSDLEFLTQISEELKGPLTGELIMKLLRKQ